MLATFFLPTRWRGYGRFTLVKKFGRWSVIVPKTEADSFTAIVPIATLCMDFSLLPPVFASWSNSRFRV